MPQIVSRERREQLLDATYRQALVQFEKDVASGQRQPAEEASMYRRRKRDYLTHLRIDTIPDEARELADRLLQVQIDAATRREFERDVTNLLIRLYDAFLERADRDTHGSR